MERQISQFSSSMICRRKDHPVWILAHESQENLAKEIADCCNVWQKNAPSQKKKFREVVYKPILEWGKFPDGFPNLFIKDVKELAGKNVIFIASFHSVNEIFAQISMLYQIPRYLAQSCTLILPYFPTGTMERIDLEGQIATAFTLATILSEIPLTAGGPVQIMIFDIHALQERFYFTKNVIPRLESAVPLLIKELEIEFPRKDYAIAFPDEGAEKRFSKIFSETIPRIICSKYRKGTSRHVKLREGDPKNKHVIIIDDLVQTGGTLIESAKVLQKAGAASVNAFVTHAVFPQNSWRKFIGSESLFNKFWITNSIPHSYEICNHPPFTMLSLATVITDSLLGFDIRQEEQDYTSEYFSVKSQELG